jgi:beta-phosphoglucomutase-like phosphatase (HAD superfamily)
LRDTRRRASISLHRIPNRYKGVKQMDEATLAIFDMAGTTVKDKGEVADAFTSALAEHRIAVTPGQLQDVRGASKRQAVMHFIPEGPDRPRRAETVYASFREHLARRYRTDGVEPVAAPNGSSNGSGNAAFAWP